MKSHAAVTWTGNFKQGQGQISAGSGVLQNVAFSAAKRFEGEAGTNPEELLAASHAACFSMAMAAELSKSHTVRSIETSATVSLDKEGEGWRITSSHLDTDADVEGISEEEFEKIAEVVKSKCPVSRALNVTITLDSRLKGQDSLNKVSQSSIRY